MQKITQKVVYALKIDFVQQTACGAPVRWLKYTTDIENMTAERILSCI